MKLAGRRILVTGAASGIGLAVVEAFAAQGARLALVDIDGEGAARAKGRLARPSQHMDIACDVTQAESVAETVKRANEGLGGIDGIVNSAGKDLVEPFDQMTLAQWHDILTTNLTSTFLVCHASLDSLKAAGGGTIVNLASGAALRPIQGRSAYSTAKAGIVMFSKSLALELAADNIRVNALCPGGTDTKMLRESAGGEVGDPVPAEILARFPLGRVADPTEMAAAALFLSSDDSSFVTGVALAADGGRTFH